MTARPDCWTGVDVGARKGFDVAVIDREQLVAGPEQMRDIPYPGCMPLSRGAR
jgi:hypothetical protein